ncbi:restriction endonuclease [Candidatus Gracilibacteria bacterium]|nr:restriction endonuclease [Candidatus Gracilibacteria bacterium]
MARSQEYEARIQQLNWPDLKKLWVAICEGQTPDWPDGRAFEYLILRAFQLNGVEIRWPFSVKLNKEIVEQIDGTVYVGGLSCLIECKDSREAKSIEVISKLRNQLLRRHGAAIGLVFSRNGYTGPALTLAQFVAPQTILLWNGEEIAHCLARETFAEALILKYRRHIEQGIADYDIRVEEIVGRRILSLKDRLMLRCCSVCSHPIHYL